jgi:4a-hydroxytetrahydrobiopterin dehydratase
MTPFSEKELTSALTSMREWQLKDGALVRSVTFKDFVTAIAFVNRVAKLAEAAGHHPDIDIRYNKVRLALVTHDAGGITENDVQMAGQIDQELPVKK